MKTVYLDELFVLNLAIDYFLLLAAAKICALPFARRRFAAGAAVGALWSCAELYPALAFLRHPLLHPVLALGMTLIAFGNVKRLWRCWLAFLGVSALFGGAVWAAGLYRGILSRGPIVHIDMRVLVFSFALCWALVSLVFRRSAQEAERRIHDVTLARNGRFTALRALADTGNGVFDPLSGCGVLIAEANALAPLFSPSDAHCLTEPPADAMLHIPGMRLVPCAGIDGKRRLLLAFRPDAITVDGTPRRDLIVAVAPAPLGGGGSYDAIL